MSNEIITNQSCNHHLNSHKSNNSSKDVNSDIEIVSIDEEEFVNSFEGFVRMGEDYQVDEIPELKRATADNIRRENYKLYIWWDSNKISPKEGKNIREFRLIHFSEILSWSCS